MDLKTSSAEAFLAWYRAHASAGLPDGTPAWVAIGWACDRSPSVVPAVIEAARAIFDAGSDLERSEWLSVIVDRDDRLTRELLTHPPQLGGSPGSSPRWAAARAKDRRGGPRRSLPPGARGDRRDRAVGGEV